MDPDAALEGIRTLVIEIQFADEHNDGLDRAQLADMAVALAESVENLDAWVSSGGFLPAPWRPAA